MASFLISANSFLKENCLDICNIFLESLKSSSTLKKYDLLGFCSLWTVRFERSTNFPRDLACSTVLLHPSDLEGLKEVIDIGKTGYVFNPKTENDLSSSILNFFKDYEENYYKNNIQSYKSNFVWSNFEGSILKLLGRLNS